MKDLEYGSISIVLDIWEKLRQLGNFEEKVGSLLYQRLFTECSESKMLFGFPIDIDPKSEELLTSRRFTAQASYLIQMLDTSLNMLGPDTELLTEIMLELGQKHVRYGVTPEMYPIMFDCLIGAIEESLKIKLSNKEIHAWKETYGALAGDMMIAAKKTPKA